jgi:ACR3 family arsenite efflux pump ArsB
VAEISACSNERSLPRAVSVAAATTAAAAAAIATATVMVTVPVLTSFLWRGARSSG